MSTRPPIEGDGVRVNFFNFLLRTPGEVAPPLRVSIPDTIVFEHNCPRSWFYYDVENKEIRKRAGRDLQAGTILAEFGTSTPGVSSGSGASTSITTVATFTYLRHEDGSNEPAVTTLYLTKEGLEKLLITTSVVKLEGILQKHFLPIELNECVIQATWGAKLCLIRRRMNHRTITDRPRLLSEKHCTFDGPDHLSIEVSTAKDTVGDITHITERIVEHVARTARMKPVSMMLYFKLDQQRKPRLLWCSSLRFDKHPYTLPPACVFVSPELESPDTTADDTALDDMAIAQSKLERRSRPGSPTHADGGGGSQSPSLMSTAYHTSSSTATTHYNGTVGGGVILPPEAMLKVERISEQWHTFHDETDIEANLIQEQRLNAKQIVDDALYAVLAGSEGGGGGPTAIRLPPELSHLLGGEARLLSLTHSIGLVESGSSDMGPNSTTHVSIATAPPVAVMMTMAQEWLDKHFAHRMASLLDRAATQVQWVALQAVLPLL
ncbi:Hypothetical protein, putative [Bodo saltans]|uniref:Uncharacterized protein n=1 Tax=Bodo saltans TaxID=75058 RepID=A0A0S4J099_BODSA|nr:Hypothetical protein, putative [Bodo saltans]|eukprot:CUG36682.1 Hypothetical protein, putative [Bodo saltans]